MALKPVEEFRGDTWIRAWGVRVDNQPIDIIGATARLHLKESLDDEVPVFEVSTTPSAIGAINLSIEPPSEKYINGRTIISMRVEKETMETLIPKKKYYFDIEYTFADGTRKTYEQNILIPKKDATRNA